MERDLDETLLSQEKMLARLGQKSAPREQMKRSFSVHLERLHAWLKQQPNMHVLCVSYNDLVERPGQQAERVYDFLHGKVNVAEMVKAVDATLYRNRKMQSS
jgi:hypothetical protein